MAVDAAAPDGAVRVTTEASNAQVARSADTDMGWSSQARDDEMTTSTTEPASNQFEAESRPVDGVAKCDQEVADDEDTEPEASAKPRSPVRLAVIFSLVAVVGLAALAGWLETRAYGGKDLGQHLGEPVRLRESGHSDPSVSWVCLRRSRIG
jgi:hypothetical protein